MTLKNITDNVKYRLGEKTLLICVYDDSGKEIAVELFIIGYNKSLRPIIEVSPMIGVNPVTTLSTKQFGSKEK